MKLQALLKIFIFGLTVQTESHNCGKRNKKQFTISIVALWGAVSISSSCSSPRFTPSAPSHTELDKSLSAPSVVACQEKKQNNTKPQKVRTHL